MNSEKYIVIGDIHGCAKSLDALLGKVTPYSDRSHIFIGDYIDRGPDSRGVVDHVREFARSHRCVFLRGNHESMLMEAVETGNRTFWLMNGGMETLDSYDTNTPEEIPADHLRFFCETRLWLNTPEYLFIHAGLDPKRPVDEQLSDPDIEHTALWERRHVHRPVLWEKTVVFGHTPVTKPLIEERKIAIDTGCVFQGGAYGTLTALLLPEKTIITQVNLD